MAMLAYDDSPRITALSETGTRSAAGPAPDPAAAVSADVDAPVEPDDEVQERWLQAQPWPRRWFARFYRALRKLQPAFPPMSCC
ncbi:MULTISPECIES: hypothetical protein [Rhodopseudomonas]|jgi:hypothetical protein|uniref:hypothetical protein n=1 Tax=Rhodopseudomonas TaxID=1073 RepID=UPI000642307E|nr:MULTISPECIES: hypothetical protein [Rhodopseudomonas]NEW89637.1 hypothetical protein [Rhodopseudomonas sp. WA056]